MSSLDSIPGSSGIIAGVMVVSIVITLPTGNHFHWLPVAVALVVGMWAVQAINR